MASELLKLVLTLLGCFAPDIETFLFLEDWLNIGVSDVMDCEHLSDAMACEILVLWINSASIDTWKLPLPSNAYAAFGIRSNGFCFYDSAALSHTQRHCRFWGGS